MSAENVDKRDITNPNIRKNYRVDVNESAIVMQKEDSFYYAAVVKNISMSGIAVSVVNKCKLKEGMNLLITMCEEKDGNENVFEFDATVRYVHKDNSTYTFAGCILNSIPEGLQEYLTQKQLKEINNFKRVVKTNKTETVDKSLNSLKPGSRLIAIVPNGRTATRYTGHVIDLPAEQFATNLNPSIPSCFFKYEKEEMFKINPKEIKGNYVFTIDEDQPYRWDKTHIYRVPLAFDDKVLLIRTKLSSHEFEQRRAKRYKTDLPGTLTLNHNSGIYNVLIKDLSLIGAGLKAYALPKLYLGMKGTVTFNDDKVNNHVFDIQIVRMEQDDDGDDIGCVITNYYDDMGTYLSSIKG